MQDNKRPFLDFIDRTKPYMDGLWDDEQGWYAEPDHDTGIPVAVTYANAHMIATTTVISGIQVLFIPSATPAIMTVAGPVWACSAMFCVGLRS